MLGTTWHSLSDLSCSTRDFTASQRQLQKWHMSLRYSVPSSRLWHSSLKTVDQSVLRKVELQNRSNLRFDISATKKPLRKKFTVLVEPRAHFFWVRNFLHSTSQIIGKNKIFPIVYTSTFQEDRFLSRWWCLENTFWTFTVHNNQSNNNNNNNNKTQQADKYF